MRIFLLHWNGPFIMKTRIFPHWKIFLWYLIISSFLFLYSVSEDLLVSYWVSLIKPPIVLLFHLFSSSLFVSVSGLVHFLACLLIKNLKKSYYTLNCKSSFLFSSYSFLLHFVLPSFNGCKIVSENFRVGFFFFFLVVFFSNLHSFCFFWFLSFAWLFWALYFMWELLLKSAIISGC